MTSDCPCENEKPAPCPKCGATVYGNDPVHGRSSTIELLEAKDAEIERLRVDQSNYHRNLTELAQTHELDRRDAEIARLKRYMGVVSRVLVEVRKELEDYTHGITDDGYDNTKLNAVITLLDSNLFA